MADPIVVVGAGGFGREVIDVIRDINEFGAGDWDLRGVVDDEPSDENVRRLATLGIRCLGTVDTFVKEPAESMFVVGVGSPNARRALERQLHPGPKSYEVWARSREGAADAA